MLCLVSTGNTSGDRGNGKKILTYSDKIEIFVCVCLCMCVFVSNCKMCGGLAPGCVPLTLALQSNDPPLMEVDLFG